MNAGRPVGSVTGGLTRLGFADPPRALRMLADPALTALIDSRTEIEDDGLARALALVADPDQALAQDAARKHSANTGMSSAHICR